MILIHSWKSAYVLISLIENFVASSPFMFLTCLNRRNILQSLFRFKVHAYKASRSNKFNQMQGMNVSKGFY